MSVQASFEQLPPQPQQPLPRPAFDRWVTPAGDTAAEFHRTADGYLVRFPEQADFLISATDWSVSAVPHDADAPLQSLFGNSILPLIGNHVGGLHLHGSAVSAPDGALAFMGLSRRGKTTLAGAFAHHGHPFLTEDVLSLEREGDAYLVQPKRAVLRLFPDSAAFLFRGGQSASTTGHKQEMPAGTALPFASSPSPLRAIFILGPGEAKAATIEQLDEARALTQLVQHAFILDVEDKQRLRAHFERIAALAASIPCHALDYPRRYEHLPEVVNAVLAATAKGT